jgi:hypothetical protein
MLRTGVARNRANDSRIPFTDSARRRRLRDNRDARQAATGGAAARFAETAGGALF